MSDNKFILQLKGQQTPKSVVEIKNDKLVAPFVNVPNSSDAVGAIIQDKDSSVVVAKGADVWKLDGGSLVPATNLSGNGSDYTGEYAVSGNMLWVNSTYTFSDTKIFTPNTKWVLQLCGKNLNAGNGDTIDFSFIVKIGSTNIMTKTVTVSEQANFFCKRFVLDFSESIQTAIKAEENTNLTVQLLCADATASATIYNGMTILVSQQRRVDGEAVASDLHTFEDLEVEVADIADDLADHIANKNNPHEVTKAQVGLGNCDNTSDLDKPISTATQTALNGKVSTDGSSIMTGPLKMRATSSFQCAIAPFWDGVGFYKLNSDDSVTLIASIETPDGFVPWVTNTYNIGSSLKKWKNLYLAGKAYISVINNGYDIAVPVTNSDDTLALKSEVDLAANSGDQLTEKGVWYAKMYSATVAPSAEDGTNYADFSQTDGQGNPIIVIYKRQNGAWVQDQTITPPAEYNGYVPVTSKIWDIVEQSGQQGGKVLWSHNQKTFTPSPLIISFEDIEVTGESTVVMPYNPIANQIVNKNYVDTLVSNSIGNATITLTQGGQTMGSFTTNQSSNATIALDGGSYHPGLFAHEWDDHLRNDVQWLRADTFSWQDGSVYQAAYNHLVDDIGDNNILYAWTAGSSTCYTKSSTPSVGDAVYNADGTTVQNTVASVGDGYIVISGLGTQWNRNTSNDTFSESETIGGITVKYMTATDGHKICFANEESNVAAIYNATGVAWYYIIDTANQRFKLPRINATKENIINSYQVITGAIHGNAGGTLKWMSDTSDNINGGAGAYIRINNASTETANMGNAQPTLSTNIRPNNLYADRDSSDSYFSGAKYLYFYVGSFTQTAIENTAGLNAELFNGKADLNLANVLSNIDFVIESQLPTAQNNFTWYRKYKSGWVEQGGVATTTNTSTPTQCNLPVTMADGGYCVTYGPTTQNMVTVFFADKQTTYFSVITGVQNVGYFAVSFNWMVCGMSAN